MASKIDWTDETWNVVVGCSKVSDGCKNCYAERMAVRQMWMEISKASKSPKPKHEKWMRYSKVIHAGTSKWTGKTVCIESKLTEPLHWRTPRKIFVCSMSDLFHESVPFEFIKKVRQVAVDCPHHTFQFLTKRAERLLQFTQWLAGQDDISIAEWPRNCWLGITAENQEMADKRNLILLQTPAAHRFVSIEPMLGGVDLYLLGQLPKDIEPNYMAGQVCQKLDLVICGGESGPGARPMHSDWVRSLRDQCKAAGVPFYFKQWGNFMPVGEAMMKATETDSKRGVSDLIGFKHIWIARDGVTSPSITAHPQKRAVLDETDENAVVCMQRVRSKKLAGHLLDGVEHRPEIFERGE